MKRLVLVDGSGFLFRAWFAYPEMMDEHGHNVNVIYGFFRMMIKLFLTMPDYFVIAWDSPIKTKRHEKYPDYKATRKKIDDEFKQQIPVVQDLVKDLGLSSIVAPGYEADDIISTLVENYKNVENLTLQVYTSDKDLKQFLSDNIVIIDSLKGQTVTLMDFVKEYGFPPKLIVDYLALVGDSADNIKGVGGIGPKKALYLVQKYGTIENIYQHLDEISGDLKEKLQVGHDSAFFSKELIELLQVPDLRFPLEDFSLNIQFDNWEKCLVNKTGFSGLKKGFQELKIKYTQPQQLGLF